MKVPEMLEAARALLDAPDEDMAGVWPHGAAVLTRQAIETTMDAFWARSVPDMRYANWTEKWLALPSYLGRTQVIPEAHYTWFALSEACHQRAYDVGLTEVELRSHCRSAEAFLTLVADAVREVVAAQKGPASSARSE